MWPSIKWLIRPELGIILALLIGISVYNPLRQEKPADTHIEQSIAAKIEPKINIEDDRSISWFLESSNEAVWNEDKNKDFAYSYEELQVMAKYWPSKYPSFNSFNDENIRHQIRENILRICSKLLTLAEHRRDIPVPRRVEDIKHIQNLYADPEIWPNRQIPKYYHATRTSIFEILNSTYIKCIRDRQLNPAAWFATGFYLTQFIFSFSSDIELPIEDIAPSGHFLNGSMNDCFCVGRKSDIVFYNSSTKLVSWAVPYNAWNKAVEFIQTLPKNLSEFYLSRGQTNTEMMLEREIISLAQIYTTDRANSVLMGSLRILFNTTRVTSETKADLTPGEILVCKGLRYTIYSHQEENRLSVIMVLPAFREFAKANVLHHICHRAMKYLPDNNIDAMQFMQLLADSQLSSTKISEYKAFNFTSTQQNTFDLDVGYGWAQRYR